MIGQASLLLLALIAPEPFALGNFTPSLSRVTVGADGAIVVRTEESGTGRYPGVSFPVSDPKSLAVSAGLSVRLNNPNPSSLRVGIKLIDSEKATYESVVDLPSRTTETFLFPTPGSSDGMPDEATIGVDGTLTRPYERGGFDIHRVQRLQFYVPNPDELLTFVIQDVSILSRSSTQGAKVLDRFGQPLRSKRPRVQSEEELRKQATQDQKLASTRVPAGRDEYGGWANGPKLSATGAFRAQKVDGKWWLVDPNGRLFFSTGIDTVRPLNPTVIQSRERLFSWLPDRGQELAEHYGRSQPFEGSRVSGETFDFYRANLERKYGPDYESEWRRSTRGRLLAWGFNTLGSWSDPRLIREARVPYVLNGWIGGNIAKLSTGVDVWGRMPDVFDPRFPNIVRNNLQSATAIGRGDPYCIGYFVDNELSWYGPNKNPYGLAIGALSASIEASPAKRFILDSLKDQYRSINRLNEAWDTHFGSWDALERPYRISGNGSTDEQRKDLQEFVKAYADRYFRTVRDELKRQDPDHMYMGSRFSPALTPPAVVKTAARYASVLGFNVYGRSVKAAASHWHDVDRPVIIGEFNFVSLDSGLPWRGLAKVDSQEERGSAYAAYVRSALADPDIVGCHWFQYLDQPATGSTYSGESSNTGFVDIADRPYPPLVAAATKLNKEIYRLRGQ